MENQLQELINQNAEVLKMLRSEQAENKLLRDKIQLLLERIFGKKSEKLSPDQLSFLFSDIEANPAPDEDPTPEPPAGKRRKPFSKRKPRLPEDLPTEVVHIDPEEVERSPENYKRIGEEVTQELDVTPAKYFKRKIIRGKYVRKDRKDEAPVIAELPERVIPGGYASAGLVSEIIIKKYEDHLPLYRQSSILKRRYGIDISRNVMSDWVGKASDWLVCIYDLIKDDLKKSNYLQADETPIRYCRERIKDRPPGTAKGYFWVYNNPWSNSVLFEWHTGRSADCLDGMLSEFKGTIQSDGYAAYGSYIKARNNIDLACCWAHARRKFWEAKDESKISDWFLKQIQALYAVEKHLRESKASAERREKIRAIDAEWRLKLIKKALIMQLSKHLPQSRLRKAMSYTLNLWDQLEKYCSNGLVEIDNNGVENAIRPSAIGKKNWLFIGRPEAGQRSAVIYTIIENCKRLGINPDEYLRDVLTRLPSMKITEVSELHPATWLEKRSKKIA